MDARGKGLGSVGMVLDCSPPMDFADLYQSSDEAKTKKIRIKFAHYQKKFLQRNLNFR